MQVVLVVSIYLRWGPKRGAFFRYFFSFLLSMLLTVPHCVISPWIEEPLHCNYILGLLSQPTLLWGENKFTTFIVSAVRTLVAFFRIPPFRTTCFLRLLCVLADQSIDPSMDGYLQIQRICQESEELKALEQVCKYKVYMLIMLYIRSILKIQQQERKGKDSPQQHVDAAYS